jgi:single-stranded-DNA-specific exonuclease
LPHGVFDLAYTLRATTYRGQPELQVTWLDSRSTAQPAELAPASLTPQVIDYRDQAHPLPVLQRLLADTQTGQIQVWAEAEANSRLSQSLGGVVFDRLRLSVCETLVIWTTPPGWTELKDVLACTQPKRVIVFGINPETDQPEAFLQRLAGLTKHVLSTLDGWTSLSRLASAMAQKELTVRFGLEWLAAMGHISMISTDENASQAGFLGGKIDRMKIVAGGSSDSPQAVVLLEQIQTLLEETHAYREFFLHRDPYELIAEL